MNYALTLTLSFTIVVHGIIINCVEEAVLKILNGTLIEVVRRDASNTMFV